MEICQGQLPAPPTSEYAAFPYQTLAVNKRGLAFCVGGEDSDIYCAYLGPKINGYYNVGTSQQAATWYKLKYSRQGYENYAANKSKVQYIQFNASGTALLCMSVTSIFVIHINETKAVSLIKSQREDIAEMLTFRRSTSKPRLGEEFIFSTFHPLKDSTVVALTRSSTSGGQNNLNIGQKKHGSSKSSSDENGDECISNIILYNLSESAIDMVVSQEICFQTASAPVSFTFTQSPKAQVGYGCWEQFTAYILFKDGSISPICPILPEGTEISGETMSYLWKSLSLSTKQNTANSLDDDVEISKVAERWLESSWVDQEGNGSSFTYINSGDSIDFVPIIQQPLLSPSDVNLELAQLTSCASSLSCVNMTSVTSTMHVPTIFTLIYKSGLIQILVGPITTPKPKWTHTRSDKYLNDSKRSKLIPLQALLLPPTQNTDNLIDDTRGYFLLGAGSRYDFLFVVGQNSVYMLKLTWLILLEDYFSRDDNKSTSPNFGSWKSELSLVYHDSSNSSLKSTFGVQSVVTPSAVRKTLFRLSDCILDVDISRFLFLNADEWNKNSQLQNMKSNGKGNADNDNDSNGDNSKLVLSSIPSEMKFDQAVLRKLEESKSDSWPIIRGKIETFDEASKAIVVLNKMKERIEAYENVQDELQRKNNVWVPLVQNDVNLISKLETEVATLGDLIMKIDDRCQKIKRSQVALKVKMDSLFSILHESKPISDAERQYHFELRGLRDKMNGMGVTIKQLDQVILQITAASNDLQRRSTDAFLSGGTNDVFLPRRMERALVDALQHNAAALAACKRNINELKQNVEKAGISMEAAKFDKNGSTREPSIVQDQGEKLDASDKNSLHTNMYDVGW